MKFRKIIMLALLLAIILTMGFVSASDDNATSETLMIDDNDDLEVNQDEIISVDEDNGTLSVTDPTMTATAADIVEGEDAVVKVTINNDATGSVTVTVSGSDKVGTIVGGKSSVTFSGLSIGNYTAHVAYAGDENYASASAYTSFSVTAPTFENLQSEIDALSPGQTLTLTKNYESTGTSISISNSITIDGDGHTLDAKGLSSIFIINAAGCTLQNLILTNAMGNGSGAIMVSEDNFHISNTEISASASYLGAAIYSSGKDGEYDNITVMNATSMGEGAVYLSGQGNMISNSYFINCYGNQASALYIEGDANTITSCAFISSLSTEDAGAVFIKSDGCMIIDSLFENNIAGGNGGALYWQGNSGIIANTVFVNNRAKNKGETTSKGGAIYIEGSDLNITSSTFTFNESESNILYGGAIYVEGNEINIYDLTFTGFKAVNGGSVYWAGNDGRVMMSGFYNSTASGNGGAVYWKGNNGVIEGCDFENCTAVNGGAVYGLNTTVSNSNFTNNIASDKGGAMYNCSFEDCEFESNTSPVAYPFKMNVAITISADDVNVGEALKVDIVLSQNITGNLTLIFDGEEYNIPVFEDSTSFNYLTTKGGSFEIMVIFEGNEDYLPANTTLMVNVNKLDPSIYVDLTGERIISIELPDDSTGNLIFMIEDLSVVTNESTVLNVSELSAGSHDYSINYTGDDKYNEFAQDNSITLPKRDISVTVITSEDEYTVGEDIIGEIHLSSLINASLTLKFDNKVYDVNALNGTAIFNITATRGGDFNLTATFESDEEYNGAINVTALSIKKLSLPVSVDFDEDNRIISVGLPGDIAGNVNFSIDGKDFIFNENMSGVVNLSDMMPGSHVYTINYAGDDKYLPYSDSGSIALPKFNAIIEITANDTFVGEYINVNVTLPGDASGMAVLVFDGANHTDEVVNGKVSFSIAATHSGEFNITVLFMGDYKYSPVNSTIQVTVNRVVLPVNVDFDDVNRLISITLPNDIKGNVTFRIGDKNQDLNESTVVNLTEFIPGNYTYIIDYAGDDKYLPYSDSDLITVPKNDPDVIIHASNSMYGESQNITLSFPDDAEGNVTFTLIDEKTSEIIETVNAKVGDVYSIPDLNVGIYTLQANYAGDAKYSQELKEVSFKVSPILSIVPEVVVGEDGLITMELGNVSGSIRVSVDGEEDGSRIIRAGKFTYYLPTDELPAGNHSITFEYTGTSFDKNVFNYWDNETNSYKPIEYLLKVNHKQTTTVSDSDNDKILTVKIEDDGGEVLTNATGKVVFTILNQLTNQYTEVVVSVVDGIAKLDISQFKDGNYRISWNYLGDSQHAPISKELTLKVTHKASRIAAGDLSLLYTTSKTYSVTVYSSAGQKVGGVPVSFLINNKVVKTTTTNANGVASIVISQVPGSYKLTAKSGSASVTKKLTVTHLLSLKAGNVKKSAKKLVIQATLKKVNGKYLKNKKITFKFNDKTFTAKTNKKGVAKVTVKSNVLKKLKKGKKVTYQATYLKDTVKKTVKVK